MSRKTYHVTPAEDGNWKVKGEGASRAAGIHEDKTDAVQQARDLAKASGKGQVVIHRRDGTIQTEWTYGQDPYPPEG